MTTLTTSNRRLRSLLLPPSSSHSSNRTSSRCSSRNNHRPFLPLHLRSLSRCRPPLRDHFKPLPWVSVLRRPRRPRLSAEELLGPHNNKLRRPREEDPPSPPPPPPPPTFPTFSTCLATAAASRPLLRPAPARARTERRLKSRAWRRLRRKSDRISCLLRLRPSRLRRRAWATLETAVETGGIVYSREKKWGAVQSVRSLDPPAGLPRSRRLLYALFWPRSHSLLLLEGSAGAAPLLSSRMFFSELCISLPFFSRIFWASRCASTDRERFPPRAQNLL